MSCCVSSGAIFFLRLNILNFKAFMCAMAPDPLVSLASDAPATQSLFLIEDMQTRCYESTHLVTVVFVILLLLCYTIGFPLFCFVVLMRSFANARTSGVLGWLRARFTILQGKKKISRKKGLRLSADAAGQTTATGGGGVVSGIDSSPIKPSALVAFSAESATAAASAVSSSAELAEPTPEQIHNDRVNRFGYLFSGYRYSHFASCLLVFVVQLNVAAITVLIPDSRPLQKLFAFGLLWAVHTLIIAVQLPFEAWTVNARKIFISLATLAHSTVLLAVQSDGSKSTFLFVLLALFSALVVLLLVRRRIPRWCGCARRRQARPKLLRDRTAAAALGAQAGTEAALINGALGEHAEDDDDEEADELAVAHKEWLNQEEEPVELPIPSESPAQPDPIPEEAEHPKPDTVMAVRIRAGSLSAVAFADLASPSARPDSPACMDSPAASRDVRLHISPRELLPMTVGTHESAEPQAEPESEPQQPPPLPEGPALAVDQQISAPAPALVDAVPISAAASLRSSLPPIPSMLSSLCKQLELHPPSASIASGMHWTAASVLPSESELLHVIELACKEYSYSAEVLLTHLTMHRRRILDAAAVSSTILQGQMQSLQLEWKLVGAATLGDKSNDQPALATQLSESFLAPLFFAADPASSSISSSSASAAPSPAAVRSCVRALLSLPRAAAFLQQLVKEATDLRPMWLQIERVYELEQQAAAMVAPSEMECILEAVAGEGSASSSSASSAEVGLGATLQSLRFAARSIVLARLAPPRMRTTVVSASISKSSTPRWSTSTRPSKHTRRASRIRPLRCSHRNSRRGQTAQAQCSASCIDPLTSRSSKPVLLSVSSLLSAVMLLSKPSAESHASTLNAPSSDHADSQVDEDPDSDASRLQLAARLKQGRSGAQCAVIDAALRDPALLSAFLLTEETKQQQVAQAFSDLRASDAQRKRVLAVRLPVRLPPFQVATEASASPAAAPSSFPPLRLPVPRALGVRGHARSPTGFGSSQIHVTVPSFIAEEQANQCRIDQARLEAEQEAKERKVKDAAEQVRTSQAYRIRVDAPERSSELDPLSLDAGSSLSSAAAEPVASPPSASASAISPPDSLRKRSLPPCTTTAQIVPVVAAELSGEIAFASAADSQSANAASSAPAAAGSADSALDSPTPAPSSAALPSPVIVHLPALESVPEAQGESSPGASADGSAAAAASASSSSDSSSRSPDLPSQSDITEPGASSSDSAPLLPGQSL